LEDACICIARSLAVYTFPADFMLICTMNACPCGYYPDKKKCTCSPSQIAHYQDRISGPILDRIDLLVSAPKILPEELIRHKSADAMNSSKMKEAVLRSRKIQERRYAGTGIRSNAGLSSDGVEKYCRLGDKERAFMEKAFERMGLSARGYHKTLKIARTIADIDGAAELGVEQLSEALTFRMRLK